MGVPHHTHSGGESGPPIDGREGISDLSIVERKLISIDPARVDESYVGYSFVEPTVQWVAMGQRIALLHLLEARIDQSFVGSCLVQA